MAQKKKKTTNSANDFTGGRDSLGPVHPPSEEEEREAAMRLTEAALRWRVKHAHSYDRVNFPLETMLLMAGIKEEPSPKYQLRDRMKKLSEKSPKTYGSYDESGE